ncbi:MAG: DNA polymerase Y family protein [Anaeromyxobacter sp.]|nr:DNA polymerase Y family protein [Anaeromyxobacter sp.]
MRPERGARGVRASGAGEPGLPGLVVPSGPRVLALHLPGLPLQRLERSRERGLRAGPSAGALGDGSANTAGALGDGSASTAGAHGGGAARQDRPVAVVEEGRVVARDAAAAAAGVRPGDTLAQALAACGRLLPVAHAPAADLAALRGLAEALLGLSPAVEVVAPDTLLLDASAAHLLGGVAAAAAPSPGAPAAVLAEPSPGAPAVAERRLLARAVEVAAGLGYAARAALATGRGPARALARHGDDGALVVAPGQEARALAGLPLEALGLGAAVEARLRAVGVDGVGALARLPAEGLALRFGVAGAAAARLARGDDPTPLVPWQPETLPEEAIELEGPAESVEPVLFVLARLAERVAARLGGRGLGASRLKLTLKLDPRGEERLLVPLARPSAAAARWLPPLRERLLGVRLPGGVTGVRLTAAEVAACPVAQLAFGDRPEVAAALDVVLARLAGRLGDGAVLAAAPADRHRPEAAWHSVPFRPPAGGGGWGEAAPPAGAGGAGPDGPDGAGATAGGPGGARLPGPGAEAGPGRPGPDGQERPTRLLATPLPVVATGDGGRVATLRIGGQAHAVLSFEGPERLRGEWWSAPFDRDYYRARVAGLGECWLYRDGADGRLWLHGFFD